MVFQQPLRQTQGLFCGLARIMGLDVPAPDFSTALAERCWAQHARKSKAQRAGPIELVVDSMCLKIFGESEWLQNKHKERPNLSRGASCT
jgi:hypothetical protein